MQIGNDWDNYIGEEFSKDYYKRLRVFLKNEYATQRVYPDMYDIFNALKYTPFSSVKAIILGQDPYHGVGQAHGFCFSVKEGVKIPPSLQNIYKEMADDLNIEITTKNGTLTEWAKEGVLLLNTTLTVREGRPLSHVKQGWETFTDAVIKSLNEKEEPVVFILWGSNARSKKQLITNKKHLILEAPHPSPLSAYNGFFGCRHFSLANKFLEKNGITPINWGAINNA
jgi:uracil-DNA glycosylase